MRETFTLFKDNIYRRRRIEIKILVINPVATEKWNDFDRRYFQNIADAETKMEITAISRGPKSIETFYDVAHASPELLKIVRARCKNVDGIVINCFADPGLKAARELTDKVVLGPAETSMCVATQLGSKFSVVSVCKNAGPWIERQAREIGLIENLASAVGVEIPVLELGKKPERTVRTIVESASKAVKKDGAEVIILGCTGMASLADKVRDKIDVPLLEPAATTFKMAEMLVKLGIRHNRGGLYNKPIS